MARPASVHILTGAPSYRFCSAQGDPVTIHHGEAIDAHLPFRDVPAADRKLFTAEVPPRADAAPADAEAPGA